MNQEKDERKMSAQTGLTSRQNYDRFVDEWYDTVLREAQKWCRSDEAARLLAEAVLNDCRQKFAGKKLPSEPEYFLKGQVCLVYSMTGPNVERLKNYILDHPFAEEVPDSEEAADAEIKAKPAAPAASKAAKPAEKKETKLPPERTTQASARAAEKPEGAVREKPDTFFDPARTVLWSPDGENNPHIVEEIVIEDDDADEEERSVGLSFFNSILFIMTAASFVFFCYETGAIQFLLR